MGHRGHERPPLSTCHVLFLERENKSRDFPRLSERNRSPAFPLSREKIETFLNFEYSYKFYHIYSLLLLDRMLIRPSRYM